MHYRTLGNSGAVVSTFALGTTTFGAESAETTSHAIPDDYIAAGGNFIHTADVYASGVSEEIIGPGWQHTPWRAGRDRHEGWLRYGRWPQRPRHVPAPPRSRA